MSLSTKDGRRVLSARTTPDGQVWSRHDDRKPPSAAGSCAQSPNQARPPQPDHLTNPNVPDAEAGDADDRKAA